MRLHWILIALCLLGSACSRQSEPTLTSANANADAELGTGPVVQRKPQDAIDWSPVRLEAGDAWVDCSADYTLGGGRPLLSLAYEDLRPSRILTRESFLNALSVVSVAGGSSNAQVHIMAIARHAGVQLDAQDWTDHAY